MFTLKTTISGKSISLLKAKIQHARINADSSAAIIHSNVTIDL